MPGVDWRQVRQQFPPLRHSTFLNTATFGQTSRAVNEAIEAHARRRDENACHDFLAWFEDIDVLRAEIAAMFGCHVSDVGFTGNSSSALALLTNGLDWKPGDQVLTFQDEFPNHIYAGASLGKQGVEFVECEPARWREALTPRTRLFLTSAVNYGTGFRPPLAEISVELHRRGVLFYVDATQGAGALRYRLPDFRPDLFAVNCYKWMLAPAGAAFFCITPELRARLDPPAIGWRSDCGWQEVESLHHGPPRLLDSAARYESGMLPFACLYGLQASIAEMRGIGHPAIEARVLDLAAHAAALVKELGGKVLFEQSPILAAAFPGQEAPALAEALQAERILVAARHGRLRISPHFYNDEDDLSRLARALRRLL